MWDNRADKKNPRAPDFKCRDKACDGVIWPPKGNRQAPPRPAPAPPTDTPEWLDDQEEAEAAVVTQAKAGAEFATLTGLYDRCFRHAVGLATQAEKAGVVVTLEGVSAIAATLFIATKSAV